MAICPVCSKKFETKNALKAHVSAKHPDRVKHAYPQRAAVAKPSKNRSHAEGSGVGGWISMEEYLGKASPGTTSMSICPGKSGMTRLDNYAILFDQYAIEKWNVRFTPRVGTTVSGMYVAGVVYSHLDDPKGVSEVAALQPKIHHAVWQGGSLSVAPQKLMKQKWMYVYNSGVGLEDSIAGKVVVVVDGTNAEVDVWVDYSVRFTGPTNTARNKEMKLVTDGSSWTLDGKTITTLPSGLDSGYSIDIEASKDSDGYFKGFFSAFKQVDAIVQGTVHYYHVLADSFIAGYALPALGFPLVMHVVRRPFSQALRTVNRSGLCGGTQASEATDRTATEVKRQAGEGPSSGASSLSGSFDVVE